MDDELQHSPDLSPADERRSSPGVLAAIVVLVALAVGGIAYFALWKRPALPVPDAAPAVQTEPGTTSEPAMSAATAAEAPPVELPSLDESDAFVRERLLALSNEPAWSSWLAGESLVRRFVATVLTLGERKNPRPLFAERISVRGPFSVRPRAGRTEIAPASYARFDGIVNTLAGLDAEAARPLWRLIRPLAESAWSEIARPENRLDDAIRDAIDHLLATPVPPGAIEVEAHEGTYTFRDPELEALSPGQKQMLRLGPENGARLRAWLASWRPVF